MRAPTTTTLFFLCTLGGLSSVLSNIVNSTNATVLYNNWTTQEQKDMDFAESLRYRNSITVAPGRVRVQEDTSVDAETRSFRSMENIFEKLCDNPWDRTKLSEEMHATMSKGWCGVCIEKRGWAAPSTLSINFKDVDSESNWNSENLDADARDCTQEKISGGRQLKMVQFFSDLYHRECFCNIHITCHDGITKFNRSWITLTGTLLKQHYKKPIKRDPSIIEDHPQWCPPDCVMFGPQDVHGMNVLRDALQCNEGDDDCKRAYVEIWGN